jgi:hypothetical protein
MASMPCHDCWAQGERARRAVRGGPFHGQGRRHGAPALRDVVGAQSTGRAGVGIKVILGSREQVSKAFDGLMSPIRERLERLSPMRTGWLAKAESIH